MRAWRLLARVFATSHVLLVVRPKCGGIFSWQIGTLLLLSWPRSERHWSRLRDRYKTKMPRVCTIFLNERRSRVVFGQAGADYEFNSQFTFAVGKHGPGRRGTSRLKKYF